jgi:hypothetical protein
MSGSEYFEGGTKPSSVAPLDQPTWSGGLGCWFGRGSKPWYNKPLMVMCDRWEWPWELRGRVSRVRRVGSDTGGGISYFVRMSKM